MKPSSIVFKGYKYRLEGGYYRRVKWKGPRTSRRRPDCLRGDGGETNLHRAIWADSFGPIPEGYHVHHKDGDGANNDLSNLELIEGREHNRRHTIAMHKAGILKPNGEALMRWRATDEGKRGERENGRRSWEKRSKVEMICEVCGVVFLAYHAKLCGDTCKQRRLTAIRKGLA